MCELGISEEDAKKHTKGSDKFIIVKCPYCGNKKKQRPNDIYQTKSIACICGDGFSYPEKFMYSLLTQLNLKFEKEYSPNWIKPKRYDFYIPLLNLIVEMDGELGHGNKIHNKSSLTIEKTLEIDNYKDLKAKEYGIEVIRIDSKISEFEYIKNNILNSKLNKLFDLSSIDWNKCEEFTLSNLCKLACDYKKNNPNLTTVEIVKIMKLSKSSIWRYLKKGNELGWCKYDAKEELRKSGIKSGNKLGKEKSKMVEIFNEDRVSLGVFKSINELDRKSEELFNVKLNKSNISAVCTGKQKSNYKGYIFSFVAT